MSANLTRFSEDFDNLAGKQPNHTAIILKDDLKPREITYAELNRLINRCAARFTEVEGLKPGDAVVALLPNSAEMIVAWLASVRAGLTFAPLACTATPTEITRWIGLVKPSLLLITDLVKDGSLDAANESGVPCRHIETDGKYNWLPANLNDSRSFAGRGGRLLISTSGSTGAPKALVLDSDKLWSSGIAFSEFHGLSNKRLRLWNYLPMSYLGGLYNLAMIPLSTGGTVLVDDPFSGGTFLSYWQTVDRYEINTLWLVPTIVNGLLKMAKRLPAEVITKIRSRVNMAFLGTAPISLEVKKQFEETFGVPMAENYGLSETTFISSEHINRLNGRLEGTTGEILPYVDVRIDPMDTEEDGQNTGESVGGEIVVNSPYLFDGYMGEDGTIQASRDSDGGFRTGDIGLITESGQLRITGRIRDILKKGGYMVSLTEVEMLARQFEGVADAAAVKIPHDFYGESYELFIQADQPDQEGTDSLHSRFGSFLQENLVKYKWPEKIVVKSSFPRTSSGKIQKHLIKIDSDQ